MQQLSRPYQIALGALVVLALAWFTVLKPSEAAEPVASLPGESAAAAAPPGAATTPGAPAAPGAAGLGGAVDKAQGAVAVSGASAAATQSAAAEASGESAAPATRAPASAAGPAGTATGGVPAAEPTKDPSAPILRDVARGKVAVLLFYSSDAADDRAVRRSLLSADRHGGQVVVRAAPIARVADYAQITEGVDVLQAPTLLVIGKGNRARSLVGFTDTRAIDQLVADVGGAAFLPRRFKGYRGRIENLCAVVEQSFVVGALDEQDAEERLTVVRADLVDARRKAGRLEAPRRYSAFQRSFEKNLDVDIAAFGALLKAQRSGRGAEAAYAAWRPRIAESDAKVQVAAKRAGLSEAC